VGLLGLLVTGIISSTLSSMDSGLNRNAGIFVRSFYLPILRPRAGEKELVLAGRLTTWGFGGLAIVMALFYSSWQDLGVFQLMMNFSALVATPYAVPLFWCLLVRRSPDWAAWSTIVVCCVVGGVVSLLPTSAWAATLAPGKIAMGIAWARDHGYAAITLANVALGSLWFLGAAALAKRRALTPKRSAQVEQFFRNVDTDITPAELDHPDDARHRGIAQMCLVYGAFIALLAVISPTWSGRFWLLFCALFMLGVGAAIRRATRPRPDVPPTAP
jgi:Na+/proline symporter